MVASQAEHLGLARGDAASCCRVPSRALYAALVLFVVSQPERALIKTGSVHIEKSGGALPEAQRVLDEHSVRLAERLCGAFPADHVEHRLSLAVYRVLLFAYVHCLLHLTVVSEAHRARVSEVRREGRLPRVLHVYSGFVEI